MEKIRYLILTLIFAMPVSLLAQTNILSGFVYELVDGKKQPLPGANVVVVDKQNRILTGVATSVTGEYNIQIPANEEDLKITASFVGMKSQTVNYRGQNRLDFVLTSEEYTIEEFVVEAQRINRMGITDKEQTAATQRIMVDEITQTAPIVTIEEALQGRISGLDIVTGGDPGAKSSIRIRGANTLNANAEPLIVIDGIPYSTDIDQDFNFATASMEEYGQLLNIAPTDIESIEVLKDAAATAVWGTKGGNGVLIVNTKKGRRGKTNFSFSSKFTTKVEPDPMPMLNGDQYVALMQDAIWNTANVQGIASSSTLLELLYNTPEINYMPEWRYFDEYNVNTNWLDEVRRNAFTSDNNFAMSGGGDKATYRFSLGYLRDEGTTIGTALDRFSSSMNVNYRFSDRLRIDAEINYTQTERDDNYNLSRNVRSEALAKMPNKSPYWIDDVTKERTTTYFSRQNVEEFQGAFDGKKNYNPIALAKEGYNITSQKESRVTFRLNYFFMPELTYIGWVSMNPRSVKNKKFLPQVATGVTGVSEYYNRSNEGYTDRFVLQTENKLLFRKNWNEMHNVIATALFRTSQAQSSSYTGVISGTASPGLADPITGGHVSDIGSGSSETRTMSGIFNLHYTLMNRYMFSTTVNMEGNSSLGKSERWGIFPAVGFAWQAQEEEFLKDVSWVDQAKLRFGLGYSGNSPSGTAPYVGTFKALDQNYIDMPAIAPMNVQLNKLKWESSREYNVGGDFIFLDNKLSFTFDWYNKRTSDLLQRNIGIPTSTGFSTIAYYNSGVMTNNGVEFRVDYEIFRDKNWSFSVNANVSRNINKIVELPENLTEESYSFGNGNYAQRLETGVPVGSFFGYKYLGVYQNSEDTYARDANGNVMKNMNGEPIVMQNGNIQVYPGDAKYDDINHDGVINEYDIVYIGNGMPILTGGGGFQIKYKGFNLTTFFHGRIGQKVINAARMNSEAMYGRDNQSKATLRRWRNEGDDTDIPRALYNYGYNYLGSDRFVENASFLRLKTLSFSYSVPSEKCKHFGISNLNFFITGYDLFTWTNYSGQDPEVSLPGSPKSLVTDNANTPVSMRFAGGININF